VDLVVLVRQLPLIVLSVGLAWAAYAVGSAEPNRAGEGNGPVQVMLFAVPSLVCLVAGFVPDRMSFARNARLIAWACFGVMLVIVVLVIASSGIGN
jgi:hypothetical protein